MKFIINGSLLIISIDGVLCSFPNNDAGYNEMAAKWWQWRSK